MPVSDDSQRIYVFDLLTGRNTSLCCLSFETYFVVQHPPSVASTAGSLVWVFPIGLSRDLLSTFLGHHSLSATVPLFGYSLILLYYKLCPIPEILEESIVSPCTTFYRLMAYVGLLLPCGLLPFHKSPLFALTSRGSPQHKT